MINGFIRLGVIALTVTWIAAAYLQWQSLERDIWLVEQHISPHLNENILSKNGWPVSAADPTFLALPVDKRIRIATDFYDKHVRSLETHYSVGRLEQWMVETAQLSLEEAPIGQLRTEYSDYYVLYRKFDPPGTLVTPKLSYVAFSESVLLFAPDF
jgi:hypothetical protein